MREILSLSNPRIKDLRKLRDAPARARDGLFLVEGEHLVEEALKAGQALEILVENARLEQYAGLLQGDLALTSVSPQIIKSLSDSKTPQGIMALCRCPQAPQAPGQRIVALNRMQDPGNVGTILRTLDAAGFDTLVLDKDSADPYSPKALRASMGAIFHVPILRCEDLEGFLELHPPYQLIAGDLNGSPFFDHPPFSDRLCILIGNEGRGISENLLKKADLKLKLPIPGKAESLNAAVACGIMVYEVLRLKLSS